MKRYIKSSITWKYGLTQDLLRGKCTYDSGTFDIDGNKFRVSYISEDSSNPKFNDTVNIHSIHPYDNAEYCYFHGNYGTGDGYIAKDGKILKRMNNHDMLSDAYIQTVARQMLKFDEGTEQRIDKS